MKIHDCEGLTFDDVLLVPKRSGIASRSAVDTSAQLSRRIRLVLPVISANMDTVTEAAMAITIARVGGLGAIHRFMTIERQAAEVKRVKRAESYVVETPATISSAATVEAVRKFLEKHDIGGLLVIAQDGSLAGLVTTRDVLFAPDPLATVASVMTPRSRLVTLTASSSPGADQQAARALLHQHRIEKLPVIDGQGRLVGLITATDLVRQEKYPQATKDSKGHLCVAAAVGVKAEDLMRAQACVEAGADALVVDIAHGHSEHAMRMVSELKRRYPEVDVIAGNVATAEGVRDLAQAGADAVKVGVGAGSICVTRVVTGFGVPQFTAILECAVAGKAAGVPIIADGGIRNGGDLTKALAGGAETVMVGGLLAGTEEAPGAGVVRDGVRYKVVRGMASLTANIERQEMEHNGEVDAVEWDRVIPEGVEALVPYRGTAVDILYQLVGGLRSGMSYAGARTLAELHANAEFIRITASGMRESGSHDVERIG